MPDWRQRGRPDDIPLDIWNAAVAATSVLPHAYGWRKITESVARAILTERLNCQSCNSGGRLIYRAGSLSVSVTGDGAVLRRYKEQ